MSDQIVYQSPTDIKGKLFYYSAAFIRTFHAKYLLANRICSYLPDYVSGVLRTKLYRIAGFKINNTAFIMGNLELISGDVGFYEKLSIAEGVVMGNHITINLDAEVTIEKNVTIGPFVRIYTGTHKIGPGSNRCSGKEVLARPVTIESGSWVGLGATLLPGVTIGHGSIVAASAVVTEDVPPNSYVEGNPAIVVQELPWGDL